MPEAVADHTGSPENVTLGRLVRNKRVGTTKAAAEIGVTHDRYLSVVTIPGEEWRPLPGHEKTCVVSSLGRVKRRGGIVCDPVKGWSVVLPKIYSPVTTTGGYFAVTVTEGGVAKMVHIHVAVCKAFCCGGEGPHTRHLDGNPHNNRPSNLMRGTPKENMQDAVRHGRVGKPRRRLTPDEVIAIRGTAGMAARAVAARFGISRNYVLIIRRQEAWKNL